MTHLLRQMWGPLLLVGVLLPAWVSAQDTLRTGRDVTRIALPNGQQVLQMQNGANYFDAATHRYQARHSRIDTGSGGYEYEHGTDFRFRMAPQAAKWGVWVGAEYVIWHPVKPVRPLRPRKGQGTIFYPAMWDSVDVRLTVTPEGLKEDYILKAGAADSLVLNAEFSAVPTVTATGIAAGPFFLPHPTATGADGAVVPTTFSLIGPRAGQYRYTLHVDPTGAVYPITVDPTIVFNSGTGSRSNDARIEYNDSTDLSSGTIVLLGANSGSARATLVGHFEDSLSTSATVDSIVLSIKHSSTSGIAQDSLVLLSLQDSARYGGAAYPTWFHKSKGVGASVFWNTAGLKGGFDYDSVGLDTAYKSAADTNASGVWMWRGTSTVGGGGQRFRAWADSVVKGTKVNYGWFLRPARPVQGTGARYHVFHAAGASSAANRWTVTVYYRIIVQLTTWTALNDSSIRAVVDTAGATGANDDTVEIRRTLDSAIVRRFPTSAGLTDTGRAYIGDSAYTVFVSTVGTGGGRTWGDTSSFKTTTTLAKAPRADTVAGYSPNTIFLTVPATSNTPKTHVVVWDSTNAQFVDRLGNLVSAASDTPWARRDQYFPLKANKSRIPSTKYRLMIRARAQDSVISALGPLDSAFTNSLVKTVTLARIDTTKFSVQTAAESVSTTFTHVSFYAIDGNGDGVADTILTDTFSVTTGTTLLDTIKTTNATLVPNQKVIARRYRRENPDSLVRSGLDTFFTNPKTPTLDTSAYGHVIQFVSDTSAILRYKTRNRMPFLFAIQDSYSVAKDSPRVWWKPDSFSLAADTAWLDTTRNGFSGTGLDTVVLLRAFRPWPQNARTNVRMYYKAGDSLYNDLK